MKNTSRPVDRREKDIKKKLSAAILMLLVSCIMVVTSTYAWFTLSTAPEVKGISTTIGGNGNLEIALAGKDASAEDASTWTTGKVETTSSAKDLTTLQKNITWGNIIDVSADYGVEYLTLSPAKLNETVGTEGSQVNINSILSVPKYGADGRVSELADGVMKATYSAASKAFVQTSELADDYGLRALGISTAMTERQSLFLSAISNISSNVISARTATNNALYNNGGTLGEMVVKLAANSDRTSLKFTRADYLAVEGLIDQTTAAVATINDAMISLVDAYIASAAMQYTTTNTSGITDLEYEIIHNLLEGKTIGTTNTTSKNEIYYTPATTGESATITVEYTVPTTTGEGDSAVTTETEKSITISGENDFFTIMDKYVSILTNLNAAKVALPDDTSHTDETTYTWAELDDAVFYLMDIDNGTITVAGYSKEELKDMIKDMDVTKLAPVLNNLVVELGPNSGVYYDIASLVGTVTASIKLDIVYGTLSVNDVDATIQATSTNPLIPAASTYVVSNKKSPSAEGSEEANIISDRYGFMLDLLFRTNAKDSNLLLQTIPTDRIYSDNTNSDTMGSGSTMTFKKTVSSFSDESMLGLASCIRIVFMDQEGHVFAKAAVDTGSTTLTYATPKEVDGKEVTTVSVPHYTTTADGITANIRLIESEDANGNITFADYGYKYVLNSNDEVVIMETTNEQSITALTQNIVKNCSVLVYLDGEKVENKDVANAASSMTANINLQFASSAELEAMEYSGLHQSDGVTRLAAPTRLGLDNTGKLAITDGANSSWKVTFNNVQKTVSSTSVDLTEGFGTLSAGDHVVSVVATDSLDTTADSVSKSLTVRVTADTENEGKFIVGLPVDETGDDTNTQDPNA